MVATFRDSHPRSHAFERLKRVFAVIIALSPSIFAWLVVCTVYVQVPIMGQHLWTTCLHEMAGWQQRETAFRRADVKGVKMPAVAEEIVAMVQKHHVETYVFSTGLYVDSWPLIRARNALWPARHVLQGALTFQSPQENVSPGCTVLELGQEVHLVACP